VLPSRDRGAVAGVSARRRVAAVLAACVVVALAVVGYAGARHASSAATVPAGTVRLGPESGEDVAAYLARLPATLPPDGVRTSALVQLATEVTPPQALGLVAGTTPRTAVFRVPLPRVQTALRFVALEDGLAPAAALDNARGRADQAAAADAVRLPMRSGAIAAAEARALADPACRCVLAVLVDGDRAALVAVAGRAGVRAVEAAPPDTTEPALAPLLPEQTARADPPPDDGPVPAAP
jgi:hypothetical protein